MQLYIKQHRKRAVYGSPKSSAQAQFPSFPEQLKTFDPHLYLLLILNFSASSLSENRAKTAEDQSNMSTVLHNLTLPSTPYWPSYVHKHVHVQSIFGQTHWLFGAQCLCNCMRGGQVFRMQRSMYIAPAVNLDIYSCFHVEKSNGPSVYLKNVLYLKPGLKEDKWNKTVCM